MNNQSVCFKAKENDVKSILTNCIKIGFTLDCLLDVSLAQIDQIGQIVRNAD